jgi:glycosyltransferase involved in cell wall biosynthesis
MPHMALVGNLMTVHKGQDILLSVLNEAKWKARNWRLNIYGDGPDRAYLEQLTRYYQLQDSVTFHGRIPDIRDLWTRNHLLVMPSHMEGMPLAIVEAMLCGRPCVATDVGGVKEWIKEGFSGYVAEAATLRSFDEALERAWADRERWETVGRNGRESALAKYDPDAGRTLLNEISAG